MEYTTDMIQQVWEKGRAYTDISMDAWREDECGAWMSREDYGRADSEFGWKIVKVTADGPDAPGNLRPFHYRNDYDIASHKAKRRVTADRSSLATFERTFEPHNREV